MSICSLLEWIISQNSTYEFSIASANHSIQGVAYVFEQLSEATVRPVLRFFQLSNKSQLDMI